MTEFAAVPVRPYLEMPADPLGVRIPTKTELFRTNARLTQGLGIALETKAAAGADVLTVLSVGASIGAELDSVLAYADSAAPEGVSVRVLGIDTNPEALKRARMGRYKVGSDVDSYEAVASILTPAFGRVKWDRWEMSKGRLTHGWMLSTNNLRRKHDFGFVEGDLGQGLQVEAADLIFCNNVLYHHTEARARRLVQAMIAHLKPEGILSLEVGYSDAPTQKKRSWLFDYVGFREELDEGLSGVGVVPIATDVYTYEPHLYQRAA